MDVKISGHHLSAAIGIVEEAPIVLREHVDAVTICVCCTETSAVRCGETIGRIAINIAVHVSVGACAGDDVAIAVCVTLRSAQIAVVICAEVDILALAKAVVEGGVAQGFRGGWIGWHDGIGS